MGFDLQIDASSFLIGAIIDEFLQIIDYMGGITVFGTAVPSHLRRRDSMPRQARQWRGEPSLNVSVALAFGPTSGFDAAGGE